MGDVEAGICDNLAKVSCTYCYSILTGFVYITVNKEYRLVLSIPIAEASECAEFGIRFSRNNYILTFAASHVVAKQIFNIFVASEIVYGSVSFANQSTVRTVKSKLSKSICGIQT